VSLDSLSSDKLKAVERVVGTALVSQTDAFNQHCQAVVVVEVAASWLVIKLCELRQRCLHAVQHRVEKILAARNHGEYVPHVHHLLHSTMHTYLGTARLSLCFSAFVHMTRALSSDMNLDYWPNSGRKLYTTCMIFDVYTYFAITSDCSSAC